MALSRKKKIIIGIVAAVVLIAVVVVSVIATRKEEPEVVTVKLDIRPELKQTVTSSGEVRPIRYIKLTSEVPGRIEEIYVNPGDMVTKGKPLVRIDPTQLQSSQEAQWAATQASINDVQNARNAVTSAQQSLVVAEASVAAARQQVVAMQTNVDKAQVELNTAQRELKRYTELIESGVASRFEYDTARDRYETAKIALETAKANLEAQNIAVKEAQERANQQRIAVKDAQTSIKSSEMRASQQQAMLRGQQSQRSKATQLSPLTGVIADIPTRVGEYAVSQLSTTPLMTIADMSQINIEVNVDETEINNVQVGQEAKVKVDALGEKELKAVVIQKNPLAIAKSDATGGLSNRVNVQEAKEFKVTLELRDLSDEVQKELRPGMSSTATITTNTKNNVLAVPLESIVEKAPATAGASPSATVSGSVPAATPVGEKPKSQKGVYIVEGNKVRFIEVTTGITGEADIEVTSGVQKDMEIVRGPSRVLKTLKDGMTIKRQTKKPGNANGNEAS
ncbi:MAG TPA: efflux RND transporter periplasmic adaptor subunit [Pyrinomonadaceae bacterium]|jgi:HlyD family secretion protein|nr:efflux RND transporter periplasmic adaptor subunit [Pyrinomonadaceae bacterium]